MSPHEIVDQFVVEMLPNATLARQVEVSRAMAERAATPIERKQWMRITESLTTRAREVQQLYFGEFPV